MINPRIKATEMCKDLCSRGFVAVSIQTTGIRHPEPVQIAAVNSLSGDAWLTLVKPTGLIETEAAAIHGITTEMVADAPDFDSIHQTLRGLVVNQEVIFYNSDFSKRALAGTMSTLPPIVSYALGVGCAQILYAEYEGALSKSGSYRPWSFHEACRRLNIPTPAGDALSKAHAIVSLVQAMAGQRVTSA